MRYQVCRPASQMCLVFFITLLLGAVLPAAEPEGQLVRTEMTAEQTRLWTGHELYAALCSSCHGIDGRGDGPASPALMVPASDLTNLARRNGGEFPAIHTLNVILGDREISAHGAREMPVWEDIFRRTAGSPAMARHLASNLNDYIKALQVEDTDEAKGG